MIELGKHYRTRDGKYRTDNDTLRVLMVDGGGDQPVTCANKERDYWVVRGYCSDGSWMSPRNESDLDLIEIKPRRKGEVWVNCYEDGHIAYSDLMTANDKAWGQKRIACVRVEFEYEEGEGL